MFVIFRYALTSENDGFTLSQITAILDPVHLKALVFSLQIAIGSTLICILLSYPLVMAMKRLRLGKQGFALFILILPMWMNFILRILAWQMILSNNGILNFLLQRIGLEPLAIANSGTAIMIGMVYDYLPYMVLPVFNAIAEIDEDIIEAAKDLGSGKPYDFSENHISSVGSGAAERNCNGICAVYDLLCGIRYFRRRKATACRQYH